LSYLRGVATESRAKALKGLVQQLKEDWPSVSISDLKRTAAKIVESRIEVELTAGEAVAEEAEDLRDATPRELNDLSIVCTHPKIAIQFGPQWARVRGFVEGEDNGTRNVVDDVARFFRARRTIYVGKRLLTRLGMLNTVVLVPLLLGTYWFLSGTDITTGSRRLALKIYTGFALVAWVVFPLAFDQLIRVRQTGGVIVIPQRRKDAHVISSQTKRNIAIGVLSAVVGTILGIAGTLITTAVAK
jgi:hypothetical protein